MTSTISLIHFGHLVIENIKIKPRGLNSNKVIIVIIVRQALVLLSSDVPGKFDLGDCTVTEVSAWVASIFVGTPLLGLLLPTVEFSINSTLDYN